MKKGEFTSDDKKLAHQAAPLAAADLIGGDFWAEVQARLVADGELVEPRAGQKVEPR